MLAQEWQWLQHAPPQIRQSAAMVAVALVVLMVLRPRFTMAVLVGFVVLPLTAGLLFLLLLLKLAFVGTNRPARRLRG